MKYLAVLTGNAPLILYHGRSEGDRPFSGDYIFLTPDKEYASRYAKNSDLFVYTLKIPEKEIFSFRRSLDRKKLRKEIDPQSYLLLQESVREGEIDWASTGSITNDEYELTEDLLQHLGFKGIWLAEREGIKSIYLFNQKDAKIIGREKPIYPNRNIEELP